MNTIECPHCGIRTDANITRCEHCGLAIERDGRIW